jgi:DNA mismatch repair ATPase MutL
MDELTTLYRRLSKDAHPDLYPANERSLRTLVMQQINDAYRRKDLESLRQFSQQYPQDNHDAQKQAEETAKRQAQIKAEEAARKQRLEEERRRAEMAQYLFETYNMRFDVDKLLASAKTFQDTPLQDGTYLTEEQSLSLATLLMMQEGK